MSSKNSAIGVDLGSSRFVIAAVKRGGVEIIINEASYRSTPCLVSFGSERLMGDKAKGKIRTNLKNTVRYPTLCLGSKSDGEFAQERKFSFSPMVRDDSGKVGFNLLHEEQRQLFSSEQILSSVLTQLKRVLDLNQVASTEIVISVPSYFTYSERQAVLDASKIAGLDVIRLYNESTAVVMNYGIFRKADLDLKDARLVGFVDFGESKTSIFFANIYKDRAEILLEVNDRHLGTRDIDANMTEYYCKLFEQKNGIDLHENPKSLYRLIEAIQKQRTVLSGNSEASVNIECLFEDIDFNHSLTREEYEKINANVFERFANLLKQSTNQLGDDLKNLHSIERIGGGSRLQMIENITLDVFKISAISKTLDATESIARGCAIQAAMLSPNYQVSPFEIKERNYYPINVNLCYQGEEQSMKNTILFKKGHHLDSSLTISIKKQLPLSISLTESGPTECCLLTASIEGMKPKHKIFEGKLWFTLNKNAMTDLLKAEMVEKFKTQEKVPKAKKEKEAENKKMEVEGDNNVKMEVEAEEDFELKEKDNTMITQLAINITRFFGLSQDTINQLIKEEENMRNKEQLLIDTHNSKYFLESYIYETRNRIGEEENSKYILDGERQSILAKLVESEEWLYSEGMNSTKEIYDSKLMATRKVGDIFYNRYNKIMDAEAFYGEAFPAFTNFETNNSELLVNGSSLQLNEISTKMNESMSYLEETQRIIEQFCINKTEKFDLEKIKKTINDNYRSLENILKNIKRNKDEAERKKKEEERKKMEEEKKAKDQKTEEQKTEQPNGKGEKMQEEPF